MATTSSSTDPAEDEPAVGALFDEFRNARNAGRNDRATQGERLHDHHRQGPRQSWAARGCGCSRFRPALHRCSSSPGCDDGVVQRSLFNHPLDLAAHRPVAHQHEFAGLAPQPTLPRHCLDEEGQSFLRTQSTHEDQARLRPVPGVIAADSKLLPTAQRTTCSLDQASSGANSMH